MREFRLDLDVPSPAVHAAAVRRLFQQAQSVAKPANALLLDVLPAAELLSSQHHVCTIACLTEPALPPSCLTYHLKHWLLAHIVSYACMHQILAGTAGCGQGDRGSPLGPAGSSARCVLHARTDAGCMLAVWTCMQMHAVLSLPLVSASSRTQAIAADLHESCQHIACTIQDYCGSLVSPWLPQEKQAQAS